MLMLSWIGLAAQEISEVRLIRLDCFFVHLACLKQFNVNIRKLSDDWWPAHCLVVKLVLTFTLYFFIVGLVTQSSSCRPFHFQQIFSSYFSFVFKYTFFFFEQVHIIYIYIFFLYIYIYNLNEMS